ncbi:MAG: enoyl-CoA hydratase-related protein [Acidimicrobiales bacterium]
MHTFDETLCTYEVDDNVATIAFNRPDQMNGMTGDMEVAYFGRLLQAQADPSVRVIVVTGTGRGFCPGADLAHRPGEGQEPLPNAIVSTRTPLEITKPTIAMINGACAGVGLAYALQCDFRVAAAGVKFTTAFARRGLIGEYGMPWLLHQIAGRATALDLLITARVFLADEAFRLGLVNAVAELDDLRSTVMALASDIAANVSPASAAVVKYQVTTQSEMDAHRAMDQSDDLMRQSLKGPDVGEGIASFLERRPVAFPPLGEGTTFDLG